VCVCVCNFMKLADRSTVVVHASTTFAWISYQAFERWILSV